MIKTLHITQQKKWFDMVAAGIKKEEYREIKPYWAKRLIDINHPEEEKGENRTIPDNIVFDLGRHSWQEVLKNYFSKFKSFDRVISRNGYSKGALEIAWQHKGITVGTPNPEWCPPEFHGKTFFILEIGKLL